MGLGMATINAAVLFVPDGGWLRPGANQIFVDALAAANDPAQTTALYYVADGSGGHVFADTLDEHNRNAAAWGQRYNTGMSNRPHARLLATRRVLPGRS